MEEISRVTYEYKEPWKREVMLAYTGKTHPMEVECPNMSCRAAPGEPCQTKSGASYKHGTDMDYYHLGRKERVTPIECPHPDCTRNRSKVEEEIPIVRCWCECGQDHAKNNRRMLRFVPNSTHKVRYGDYQP